MKLPKYRFAVTCSHGFEPFLETELKRLNLNQVKSGASVVQFTGTVKDAYRAMLWSRLGSRVLLELGRFEGTTQEELYEGILAIPWEDHMTTNGTLWIDFTGYSKDIRHTQFAARKAKDAIVDRFRDRVGSRPSVDKDADLRIHIHLSHALFTVSIDLCGTPLHIRTPDKHITDAPLKESLAAVLLYASGWDRAHKRGVPLLDPMCGSGTIALEAMGLACNRAPGLIRRDWNAFRWLGFEQALWDAAVESAKAQSLEEPLADVYAFDIDASAIDCVRRNARSQGVPTPHLRVQPLTSLSAPTETGMMVTNPPYGERIGSHAHVAGVYQELGAGLQNMSNWQCYLLCQPNELYQENGFGRTEERTTLYNGPLKCRFIELELGTPTQ